MEEVGEILPRVLQRHVRGAGAPVLEVLTPLWTRVAGKAVAAQARPVAFAAGTLTLSAASPSWARELKGLSEEICTAANRRLGAPVVKQIRVRLALQPPAEPGGGEADRRGPGAGPALFGRCGTEEGAFEGMLGGLDPEVRRALGRSFAKYFARRDDGENGWR